MKKIKIYYDSELVKKEGCNIPFLFPILENWLEKNLLWYYHIGQVNKWLEEWKNIIEQGDIDECDFIVFPMNYDLKYLDKIHEICNLAKKINKKVLVFYMSDVENKLPNYGNLLVFRSSLNRTNPCNEYPMPGFPEDLIKFKRENHKIKVMKPKIWYVWYYAYHNIRTKLKYYIHIVAMSINCFWPVKWVMYYFFNYIYKNERLYNKLCVIGKWWFCRKNTIDVLNAEKKIEFDFVKREKAFNINEKWDYRDEYINNIIESDFPLVVRGFWNFSFRLSEVMSFGKIPLFIDTSCRLPFDDVVNYKELFIWVPYEDIGNVYVYIKNYIKRNEKMFFSIEKEIRNIYEKYYTLTWYYTWIIEKVLINFLRN